MKDRRLKQIDAAVLVGVKQPDVSRIPARRRSVMYLIDTVVLSELRKSRRDPTLVAWFERRRSTELFVSVISIAEIERGIASQRKSDPVFAITLMSWLDKVLTLHGERILAFDLQAVRRWGLLSAEIGNKSADLMIAATALSTASRS
jgi:toxin FitB